jgi:para-nitrobenzyl esterase
MTNAGNTGKSPVFVLVIFLIVTGLVLVAGCTQKNTEPGNVKTGAGVIMTDAGAVSGTTGNGVAVYRGIPYAAPPTGDLRWRPPAAVQPWTGVRNSTQYGAACPQPPSTDMKVLQEMNEDCLFLNVWTPAGTDEGLPVMVFIHGGSWKAGAGSLALYDGSALARKDVVVVTLNYRLGALGFFAHPELAQESAYNSSGNYGLLDQQAALKWVGRNIDKFGGDPSKITVFGESAGASSVLAHLASPGSRGLFWQAIVESGPLFSNGATISVFRPRNEAEQYGVDFARSLGISGPDAVRQMRTVKSMDLINATPEPQSAFWSVRILQFKPITDGWIIPEDPQEVFREGRQNAVPLIIGTNSDEGTTLAMGVNMTVPEYERYVRAHFGKDADRVLAQYPAGTPAEVQTRMERIMTDFDFDDAAKLVAGSMAGLNRSTYLYRFSYVIPGQPYGAFHGSELFFIFRPSNIKPDTAGSRVSDTMMDYWTRFAKTGNPNGGTDVNWPEYDSLTGRYLNISAVPVVATGY